MNIYSKNGFTLVETLVAITVLLMVIIGPMTIAQKGIQQAYFATEQATAVFLAQEAIEAVRELRDNVALTAFDVYADPDNHAEVDTDDWIPYCNDEIGCAYLGDDGFGLCGPDNNDCLLLIDEDGRYSHTSGSDSQFTRKVFISESGGIAEVSVIVSWQSTLFSSGQKEVVLQTWIYDQYQRYDTSS